MDFEQVKMYMPLKLMTYYSNLDLPYLPQGRKGRMGECLFLTVAGSSINI